MSKEKKITLREHIEALRVADQRALNIKAEGDKEALLLAREIQTYKDQQHNGTLDQLNRERGEFVTLAMYNQRHDELEKKQVEIDKHMAENTGYYASKEEVIAATERIEIAIKPLTNYVNAQQGRSDGVIDSRTILFAVIGLMISAAAVAVSILAVVATVLVITLN